MGRKKGFSFSWKRASGISGMKGKISRKTGIPLTKSGRQRKIGRATGCCFMILIVGLASLVLISFLWNEVSAKELDNNRFSTLTTLSGKQYKNVKFIKREGSRLSIIHSSGGTWVSVYDLSEDVRKQLELPFLEEFRKEEKKIQQRQQKKIERQKKALEQRRREWANLPINVRVYVERCRKARHRIELPTTDLSIGMIGYFGKKSWINVEQIVNGTEMLVKRRWRTDHTVYENPQMWGRRVRYTERNVRKDYDAFYWIKGVPTKGHIDGEENPLEGVFEVTGTKIYTTAIGGSNTVFILEPVVISPELFK